MCPESLKFVSVAQWVRAFPQDQTAFTSDSTGLYKTTNGGETWFLLEEFVSLLFIVFSSDYIHDQILLTVGLFGDVGNGIVPQRDIPWLHRCVEIPLSSAS